MKGIGGEFWLEESFSCRRTSNNCGDNTVEFVSGRTALDFIIRDIKNYKTVHSAYLPSYCCDTMVKPFVDNCIEIDFYDVYYDKELGKLVFNIDENVKCDIFYEMEYFGFANSIEKRCISFKNKGTIIIKDQTHSFFRSNKHSNQYDDYSYSSLRKWFFVPGYAIADKRAGQFEIELPTSCNSDYAELRIHASELKKQYINTGRGDKKEFLEIYNQAESLLEKKYIGFTADNYSREIVRHYDYDNLKKMRRKNAEFLLEHLKNFKSITPIFSKINKDDCPLFVPVLIDKKRRNILRDTLISNQIYCPVHWPVPLNVVNTQIYDEELSLICDQRYTVDDMKIICNVLEKID